MIREYCSSDYSRCREIVDEVWRFSDVFKPEQLADLFLDVYTGGSLAASNYALVIEDAGSVQGFLFGKCGSGRTIRTRYSGLRGNLRFLWQLVTIKGLTWKTRTEYMARVNEHEVNRLRAEMHRDNEVQLFAVSPASQGKGYGKALMEAYIQECKRMNVKRVTLDTDTESNYVFYEHFGFKRIAEFYSPIQELYSGTDGSSFVYELNLEEST